MKVLIIDDEYQRIVNHITVMDAEYGTVSTICTTPSEAIQEMSKLSFDAICLDIMMPLDKLMLKYKDECDKGLKTGEVFLFKELLPVLRDKSKKIPIVLVSAKSDLSHIMEDGIAQAYVKEYIGKPFEPSDLYEKIKVSQKNI